MMKERVAAVSSSVTNASFEYEIFVVVVPVLTAIVLS